jgi:hypothetical protein
MLDPAHVIGHLKCASVPILNAVKRDLAVEILTLALFFQLEVVIENEDIRA